MKFDVMLNMKSYLLPLLIGVLFLPSCFVADDLFLEEEEVLPLPFEVIVKDSVYFYIKANKALDQKYLSYGYDPLKIIVPKTLKDLELWKGRQNSPDYNQVEVSKAIAELDSIRVAKNLKRQITINHVFSINDQKDSVVNLQKVNFILSNELEVVDYVPLYQIEVSEKQEGLFAKFHFKSPILKAYSYEESRNLSNAFYDYFEEEWLKKDNALDRSYFLKHILQIMELVDMSNEFDVQFIAEQVLISHMRLNRSDIVNYKPIDFSQLYEINEDETLTGYYFFHTFNYQIDDQIEQMSVYVKFNPFYEVERIVESNQEYDPYQK